MDRESLAKYLSISNANLCLLTSRFLVQTLHKLPVHQVVLLGFFFVTLKWWYHKIRWEEQRMGNAQVLGKISDRENLPGPLLHDLVAKSENAFVYKWSQLEDFEQMRECLRPGSRHHRHHRLHFGTVQITHRVNLYTNISVKTVSLNAEGEIRYT